jgi:hypothetical protein
MIDELLTANFCTIFHEIDFNRVLSEVFGTDFSYCLAYNDEGRLIAVCPLHSTRQGLVTRTYSNPAMYDAMYGGWVCNRNEISLVELIKQLHLSLNESLTYSSVPQVNCNDYDNIAEKRELQTCVIDLTMSLEEILNSCLARKTRETVRSASRKGVVIERLDTGTLNTFVEQCANLKSSVGLKPFPSNYFVSLFHHYHARNKIAAFVAKLDGDSLASGMVIGNTHVMHLWVAGKPKRIPKNVPRQDLLVWEAVKWAKEQGSRYFDLCVVDEEKLPRIAKFKLGFSRNIVPFYCINKKSLSSRVLARIEKYRMQ